jgi:hypothetical protein
MLHQTQDASTPEFNMLVCLMFLCLQTVLSQQPRLESLFSTNIGLNITNVRQVNSSHAIVLAQNSLYLSQLNVTALTPSIMIPLVLEEQAYLLDIARTESETSIYVVDSFGSIFTFRKDNNHLADGYTSFKLKHSQLQVLWIRGVNQVPNTNYKYCLVNYIPEFAVIDDSANQTIWKPTAGPVAKAKMTSRIAVFVPFDGGFLDIYRMEGILNDNSFKTSDMLSPPGLTIGDVTGFSFLPQTDYFVAALFGHYMTADIVLFDANPTSLIILQSLGAWSDISNDIFHVAKTSFIVLVSNNSLLILNVLNPSARTEFAGLPSSYFWSYQYATNSIYGATLPSTFSGFAIKGIMCFEGCATCEEVADPKSCSSCSPGYILQENQCILRQTCGEGTVFNLDTEICEPIDTDGSYIAGTRTTRIGLVSECRQYFPLLPNRCKSCQDPESFTAADLTCSKQIQTEMKLTACPAQSFLDTSVSGQFCNSCQQTCEQCSNSVNSTDCLSCRQGYKMNSRGQCVSECVEGYYTDFTKVKGNLICKKCVIGCLQCNNGHNSSCTKCVPGYFLVNGECRNRCPRSFIPDKNNSTCQFCLIDNCSPCDPNEVISDGLCYEQCPDNTGTFNGRICYPCHDIKCKLLRLSGGVVVSAVTGSPGDPNETEAYTETIPRIWVWFMSALGFSIILFIIFVVGISLYQKAGKYSKEQQRKKEQGIAPPILQPATNLAWYQPDLWRLPQEEMLFMRNTLARKPRKEKKPFKIHLYPVPLHAEADKVIPRMPNLPGIQQHPFYADRRTPIHYYQPS